MIHELLKIRTSSNRQGSNDGLVLLHAACGTTQHRQTLETTQQVLPVQTTKTMSLYQFYGHTSLSDLRVVPEIALPGVLQPLESKILTEPQAIMLADSRHRRPHSRRAILCCPHGSEPRAGKTSAFRCAKKDDTNVDCTGKRIEFYAVALFMYDPCAIYGLRMTPKYNNDPNAGTLGPEYVPEGTDADKKMISAMITFLLDEKAEGANPTLELEMPDGEKKFLVRMRNVLFGIHNFYFPRAIERLERIAPVALKTAKTMRGMKLDNVAIQHVKLHKEFHNFTKETRKTFAEHRDAILRHSGDIENLTDRQEMSDAALTTLKSALFTLVMDGVAEPLLRLVSSDQSVAAKVGTPLETVCEDAVSLFCSCSGWVMFSAICC